MYVCSHTCLPPAGGNGHAGPPGGNGGSGGTGGNGHGGGRGGRGGQGSRITVHAYSDHADVLMILEVDLNGGAGGEGGVKGNKGAGGRGGDAGHKREIGKTYKAKGVFRDVSYKFWDGQSVNSTTVRSLVDIEHEEIPLYAYGQKGKTGRAGRTNVDTRGRGDGAKGKEGQVSFVMWGEYGVDETGGSPYRLIFANDDLGNIHITPLVAGVPTQNRLDALVYGQSAEFGPVAPANVGDLSSPPSKLRFDVSLEGSRGSKKIGTVLGEEFQKLGRCDRMWHQFLWHDSRPLTCYSGRGILTRVISYRRSRRTEGQREARYVQISAKLLQEPEPCHAFDRTSFRRPPSKA
jgi:hypothetical protein